MPEVIDWQPRDKPRRLNPFFYLLLAVIVFIFFGGSTAISYWVDLLWFSSLGYAAVFWKSFGLEWGTFAVFAVLTFVILFGAFLALRHHHAADLPEHPYHLHRPAPIESARREGAAHCRRASRRSVVAWPPASPCSRNGPRWRSTGTPPHVRRNRRRSHLRPSARLLSLHPPRLAARLRLAVHARCIRWHSCRRCFSSPPAAAARSPADSPAHPCPGAASPFAAGFLLLALAIREYIGRFAAALRAPHHLRRRHLHRCARHPHRHGCVSASRSCSAQSSPSSAASSVPAARWLVAAVAPGCRLLHRRRHRRLVCHHLRRQAQPARSRAALHRRQHRLHPPGLRPRPLHAAASSPPKPPSAPPIRPPTRPRSRTSACGTCMRCKDTLRQVQEIRTYYDFPDIDIDRYQHQRLAARSHAGRARAQRGQAARKQPQLDQRQAHLHPRLRHHHEPGQRLHARRPAHALL